MRNRAQWCHNNEGALSRPVVVSLTCCIAILLTAAAPLRSQTQTPRAQVPTPQWQIKAGGKMSFDVASVKRHPYDPASPSYIPHHNFPLDAGDSYASTGGLLSTENYSVAPYISFAYKLTADEGSHLVYPKWAVNEHFDIEARGPANATKDQMRLTMQSLLAQRFKLAVHWENQLAPVFAVVLVRAGKTGPLLQPDSGPPWTDASSADSQKTPNGPSGICGQSGMKYLPNGEYQIVGRNEAMKQIATGLRWWPGTGLDRPLIDETGLAGAFDYTVIWAPEPQHGEQTQSEASGPPYLEALRDQLGLKLVSTTIPMRFLLLDHIEEPSAN